MSRIDLIEGVTAVRGAGGVGEANRQGVTAHTLRLQILAAREQLDLLLGEIDAMPPAVRGATARRMDIVSAQTRIMARVGARFGYGRAS